MRLKADINMTDFIKQVGNCQADVFLDTGNDLLNLKSTLSQYVFAVIGNDRELLGKAEVRCADESDLALLSDYLIQ